MNVYELRKAILRDYKRFSGAPARADELKTISLEPAIIHAAEPDIVQQVEELRLQGFLAAISGFGGAYLKLTDTGAQQLSPEFPQSPFVYGPGAIR